MVTVFSKPNCVQCKMTKQLLDTLHVSYQEIDITKNDEVRARLVSENKKSAPVIETDTDFWIGFRPDKIKALV